MREFIVKQFEFSTHVRLFGKTFVTLRASRILFPLFVLCGIVIVGDPTTYTFYWFHVPAYLLLGLGIWFGFNFFNGGSSDNMSLVSDSEDSNVLFLFDAIFFIVIYQINILSVLIYF